MINRVFTLFGLLLPAVAYAHEPENQSVWVKLLVASFPILIIFGLLWLFMRSMNKGGKNINERILESNLEIAKELKRIADHVEKSS